MNDGIALLDRARGYQREKYPLLPGRMVEICRRFAVALRAEHAAGMGGILVLSEDGTESRYVSREEAARRMDLQADRWQAEVLGGPRNTYDRKRMGL